MDTQTQKEERLEVRITGRVQGVGFRHFATTQARDLGLRGWVRNESDGTVSLVAEGSRDRLERLLAALRSGPRSARVQDVSADWEAATGGFDRFTVRH